MLAHSTELSTVYDIEKQKDQSQLIFTSSDPVKNIWQSQTLTEARFPQLDMVEYKWFITECS